MNRPRWFTHAARASLTGLALGHLSMALLGAAGVRLSDPASPFGRAVAAYRFASGSECRFGFFAPSVSSGVDVAFEMRDRSGRRWSDRLETGRPEVDFRVSTIRGLYFHAEDQRRLVSSLAAEMFGRHPDAVSVEVRVSLHGLPTMARYRTGERPRWLRAYTATFRRN